MSHEREERRRKDAGSCCGGGDASTGTESSAPHACGPDRQDPKATANLERRGDVEVRPPKKGCCCG